MGQGRVTARKGVDMEGLIEALEPQVRRVLDLERRHFQCTSPRASKEHVEVMAKDAVSDIFQEYVRGILDNIEDEPSTT